MTEELSGYLERMRQEYREQRSRIADTQERLREVTATVTSPRREMSVTVDHKGTITELTFLTSAYKRLAPNELSGLVTGTIAEAREKVHSETVRVIEPLLPDRVRGEGLLHGSAPDAAALPEEPRIHPLVDDQMRRWQERGAS